MRLGIWLPHPPVLTCSRSRKVKCDNVQPVCGPCSKNGRQCGGSGYTRRLIIKDETEKLINKFTNNQRKCVEGSEVGPSSVSTERKKDTAQKPIRNPLPVCSDPRQVADRLFFCPVSNTRLYNAHEQLNLVVFCCKKTLTLRAFTWVMSETKWSEMIPKTMDKSEALTSAMRANAVNYLAREAGAVTTPYEALKQYESALHFLQMDLYHPVKQRSNETLFTVLLLGLFDVRFWLMQR